MGFQIGSELLHAVVATLANSLSRMESHQGASKEQTSSSSEASSSSSSADESEGQSDMPPKRKRKGSREDNKVKKVKDECLSSFKLKSVSEEMTRPFSLKKCQTWFAQYSDDPETIGPEGIERLCKDLAIEPENVVMLILAWKMQAETMGFFKLSEWNKGMLQLECDSTSKLRARLGSLASLIHDYPAFKKIYRYAFDFCKSPNQRNVDVDTATAMMKLLLDGMWPLLQAFLEFLKQSKYKVINRDQWCNVLEFSRSISPDLSNYDEDGAWPVLMDEFVDCYRRRQSPTSSVL